MLLKQGVTNLESMFLRADAYDMREGLLAYQRYHDVMQSVADKYGVALDRVIAAFCALSPNNDYEGNLRSLVSALHGWNNDWAVKDVQVSTYRHCLHRAWDYISGSRDFLNDAAGMKIRSFYHNILTPDDNRYVTIDGHMVATFRGQRLTMKEAICRSRREYETIASACKVLAFNHFIRPNQFQAVVWFVRKRVFHIKVGTALQYDLLEPDDGDLWKTFRDLDTIKPFPRRIPSRGDDDEAALRREAQQLGQEGMAHLWDHWSDPGTWDERRADKVHGAARHHGA